MASTAVSARKLYDIEHRELTTSQNQEHGRTAFTSDQDQPVPVSLSELLL